MDSTGSQGKSPLQSLGASNSRIHHAPLQIDARARNMREMIEAQVPATAVVTLVHDRHAGSMTVIATGLLKTQKEYTSSNNKERITAPSERDVARPSRSSENASASSPARIFSNPAKTLSSEDDGLFFVDNKGDRFNLTYGSSHRYAIPQYKRFGGGYILGTADRIRPDEEVSTSRDRPLPAARFGEPEFRLRSKDDNVLDITNDFVSLGMRDNTASGANDDWEAAPKEDIYLATVRIDREKERMARNAELWRALESNPQDVGLWLKLIDHQGLLVLGPDDEDSRTLTLDEWHGLADIKISLYEKALAKAGESRQKYRLVLGRLQEGAQLWGPQKLMDEWNTSLRQNPSDLNIWIKYLDYRQAGCSEFAITEPGPIRDQIQVYLFLRSTVLLREAGYVEIANGLWQALIEFCFFRPEFLMDANEDRVLDLFRIFWDSEAPRVGEANAKGWKNYVVDIPKRPRPQTTTFANEIQPLALIPSWTTAERERMTHFPLPGRVLDSASHETTDEDRILMFSDMEDILRPFHHLAAARVVIDGFLHFWQLPHTTTLENFDNSRHWDWDPFLKNDGISDDSLLSGWMPPNDNENSRTPPSPLTCPVSNFIHTTSTLFTSPKNWFNSFRADGPHNQAPALCPNRDYLRHTLRALVDNMADDEILAEYYVAFVYAFELSAAMDAAKKMVKRKPWSLRLWNACALVSYGTQDHSKARAIWAKTLSKGVSSELMTVQASMLWNCWIWTEIEQERLDSAQYILHSIPEGHVELGHFPDETHAHSAPLSATTRKRTYEYLREWQRRALSQKHWLEYVAYTDCLALSYYTSDSPFKNSIDVYDQACHEVASLSDASANFKALVAELIHQSRARLLFRYVQRGTKKDGMKPKEFRGWLKDSVTLFPHNSIFVAVFMWNESRILIMDRIRDSFDITQGDTASRYKPDDKIALTPQSVPVSNYLYQIYHEFCRSSRSGATRFSVRAAFEKALGEAADPRRPVRAGGTAVRHLFGSDSARTSVTIWKLYILYERYEAVDLKAAKAVYLRALVACPWSKELVMIGFEHLCNGSSGIPMDQSGLGLAPEELKQVYELMTMRELRIYLDIQRRLDEQFRPGGRNFRTTTTRRKSD
ncbi:hypothetical protein N7468_009663 [Penicillium chermesinum]|uniref:Uncharacterized protein n=1 Tax=Penicillium chermesinum TaxID=63820 RepID=A0A9W9TFG4_9EURO|nr:uncharacterized protein N7468_009663 [Penicillium chermesinum]KAJ5220459.1 hypothetical protein N7468_009663 [Penicillium chermesinum]